MNGIINKALAKIVDIISNALLKKSYTGLDAHIVSETDFISD